MLNTAVILAGGKGTRIKKLFPDIPKPLIPIGGIPLLERAIRQMKVYGFQRFIITVSCEAEKIMTYLGNGSRFGVSIEYFVEKEPMGSGGALPYVFGELRGTVAVLSGDLVFDIDWHSFYHFHFLRRADITLLVHPTLHMHDSDLIVTHHGWVREVGRWRFKWDEKDRVVGFYKKKMPRPNTVRNLANAGIMLVEAEVIREIKPNGFMNLEHDIIFPLISTRRVFAYRSPEYVRDVGTPKRYESVERDIKRGVVSYWNLAFKKPAVFWDRDGTLNVYKGYILKPDDIELRDGVAELIRSYRDNGYLNIVITNQPQVSFGWLTFDELEEIHGRLEWLLAEEGVYVDDIFYCPTHEDKGFEGEIPELKGYFICRKPLPGMVYEAADRYNIDTRCSVIVGDSFTDRGLADFVGMRFVEVGDEGLCM